MNIPLPAGTGNAGYIYALEQVVVPLAAQFKPELIMLSAGQDPSAFDPLAHMMVTAEGFGRMTTIVKTLASKHCEDRLVACHEGGYSAAYVPICTLRVIESLSGLQSQVTEDPFELGVGNLPTEILLDHQQAAVEGVKRIQSAYWDF